MQFSQSSACTLLLSGILLLGAVAADAKTPDEAAGSGIRGDALEAGRQSAAENLAPAQSDPARPLASPVTGSADNPPIDLPGLLPPASGLETEAAGAVAAASPRDGRDPPSGSNCVRGAVSWYGPGLVGRRTANGERFNPGALTAAHPSWPFGTVVRVTHPGNGQQVEVRINDRGPFHGDRILDLSREAAARIGLLAQGTATLLIEKVGAHSAGCRPGDEVDAPIARPDFRPAPLASHRPIHARHLARHPAKASRQHAAVGRHVTPCRQSCVKPRASAPARARTARSSVRR